MMPKRPNPFGEASPLQYKTHVGKKEVDMGVNMDQNMQQVYDRTTLLLYEGSKKSVECATCGDDNQWSATEMRQELCTLPGQLRLDSDGQLCQGGEATSDQQTCHRHGDGENGIANSTEVEMDDEATIKPRTPVKQLQIDTTGRLCSAVGGEVPQSATTTSSGCRICHSCNRPVHIHMRPCSFCDKSTCNNCVYQCCSCHGLFCQLCCVLNYDDCVERPFCLQCSN